MNRLNKEIDDQGVVPGARELMSLVQERLSVDPDFLAATAQIALKSPQSLVKDGVRFVKPDGEFEVRVRTGTTRDEIAITKYSGDREERVTLGVNYNQEFEESCTLFGGKRGEPAAGVIQHMLFYPREERSCNTNDTEAIRRARKFLKENFGI